MIRSISAISARGSYVALLVLVAQSNPIDGLSVKQIADIFSGVVTDWSQVGGRPGRIQLYSRDGKSGTFDTFDSLVLRPNNVPAALLNEKKVAESISEALPLAGDRRYRQ